MKKIVLFLSLLIITLSTKSVFAYDTSWAEQDKITKELQDEIRLAEAEMDGDEELFADDAEESNSGDDWAEEESTSDDDVAETTTPTPNPEPMEEVAEEPIPKPMPAPVKKHVQPAPTKMAKTLPKAKIKAPAKKQKDNSRVPASFKQGFKMSKSTCDLHSEPNNGSSVILKTDAGKKLWLEAANPNWYKGYHKSGFGYFPANCFK